jgi:hypothetical protein
VEKIRPICRRRLEPGSVREHVDGHRLLGSMDSAVLEEEELSGFRRLDRAHPFTEAS